MQFTILLQLLKQDSALVPLAVHLQHGPMTFGLAHQVPPAALTWIVGRCAPGDISICAGGKGVHQPKALLMLIAEHPPAQGFISAECVALPGLQLYLCQSGMHPSQSVYLCWWWCMIYLWWGLGTFSVRGLFARGAHSVCARGSVPAL